MTDTPRDSDAHRDSAGKTMTGTRNDTEMLRVATAGSVDDGKSTLIGRLLFDSKSIFEDQLSAVEATSIQMGAEYTNLALLTDGRMSGASGKVPAAIHVSPEAACGGALARRGLVHVLASDAHSSHGGRPVGLRAALDVLIERLERKTGDVATLYQQLNADASETVYHLLARAFGLKGEHRTELRALLASLSDDGLVEAKKRRFAVPGALPPVAAAACA